MAFKLLTKEEAEEQWQGVIEEQMYQDDSIEVRMPRIGPLPFQNDAGESVLKVIQLDSKEKARQAELVYESMRLQRNSFLDQRRTLVVACIGAVISAMAFVVSMFALFR
jgi:hypothetical protein